MKSFTTFELQYAHRFYNFKGEAQYLHGHTGVLTIETEDSINTGVNMVFPCNEIKKIAWDILQNFDHALILRGDDPLLPAVLEVEDLCFKDKWTKETMTVEGMIKIVYDLLKDKLNISKITFTSGSNAATEEYKVNKTIDRCPLCGIALNKDGLCPKCGYRKN